MKLTRYRLLLALTLTAICGTLAYAQSTNVPGPTDFADFSRFIANRNIFDPDRRPFYGSGPRRREPVIDSFSLVGTLSYRKGNFAFFDGTSSAYRKAVEVGDEVAGFNVTAVKSDSVTLESGTNETVMKLSTQMRREDGGPWTFLEEAGSYSDRSFASNSRRRYDDGNGRRRNFGSSRNDFSRNDFAVRPTANPTSGANTEAPGEGFDPNESGFTPPDQMDSQQDGQPGALPDLEAGDIPEGLNTNDPLTRLMLNRIREEQESLQR